MENAFTEQHMTAMLLNGLLLRHKSIVSTQCSIVGVPWIIDYMRRNGLEIVDKEKPILGECFPPRTFKHSSVCIMPRSLCYVTLKRLCFDYLEQSCFHSFCARSKQLHKQFPKHAPVPNPRIRCLAIEKKN